MSDMIGAPRSYVEEMLGRSGLELKKEIEDGDRAICYYGSPLDEEGYREYIYDNNEILVSYRKLDDVLKRLVLDNIRQKLNNLIPIGEDRGEIEENLYDFLFFKPIGSEEQVENKIMQKYGAKDYKPYIIVYYDCSKKVLERKLIEE